MHVAGPNVPLVRPRMDGDALRARVERDLRKLDDARNADRPSV
jgi:hypothetical protein